MIINSDMNTYTSSTKKKINNKKSCKISNIIRFDRILATEDIQRGRWSYNNTGSTKTTSLREDNGKVKIIIPSISFSAIVVYNYDNYKFDCISDPSGTQYKNGDSAEFSSWYLARQTQGGTTHSIDLPKDAGNFTMAMQHDKITITFPEFILDINELDKDDIDKGSITLVFSTNTTFTAHFRHI